MGAQKVVEDVQQFARVSLSPPCLRLPNILNNHVAYGVIATGHVRKVVGKAAGYRFRDVLVLRYCEDFLLGQSTKSDTIL